MIRLIIAAAAVFLATGAPSRPCGRDVLLIDGVHDGRWHGVMRCQPIRAFRRFVDKFAEAMAALAALPQASGSITGILK